jgi:hypothetical protein
MNCLKTVWLKWWAVFSDERIIWTTRGYLPISKLNHTVEWFEDGQSVRLVEKYAFEGEIVVESAHVKLKHGVAFVLKQESI